MVLTWRGTCAWPGHTPLCGGLPGPWCWAGPPSVETTNHVIDRNRLGTQYFIPLVLRVVWGLCAGSDTAGDIWLARPHPSAVDCLLLYDIDQLASLGQSGTSIRFASLQTDLFIRLHLTRASNHPLLP